MRWKLSSYPVMIMMQRVSTAPVQPMVVAAIIAHSFLLKLECPCFLSGAAWSVSELVMTSLLVCSLHTSRTAGV